MGLRSVHLALRFGLELCALWALGYWGWQAAGPDAHAALRLPPPTARRVAPSWFSRMRAPGIEERGRIPPAASRTDA